MVLDVGLEPGASGAEPGVVAGDEPGAVIGLEPGAFAAGDEPGAVAGDDPGAVAGDEPGAVAGVDPGAVAGDEPEAIVGEPGPESGVCPGVEDEPEEVVGEPGPVSGLWPGEPGVEPGTDEGVDVISLDIGVEELPGVVEFRGVDAPEVELDRALVEFWPSGTDPLLGLELPLLLTHPMGSGWS